MKHDEVNWESLDDSLEAVREAVTDGCIRYDGSFTPAFVRQVLSGLSVKPPDPPTTKEALKAVDLLNQLREWKRGMEGESS